VAQLVLREAFVRRLVEHARAGLPNEACALLGGEARTGTVTSLHPARNAAGSPYRFELESADLVRIVHAIEAAGEELVAIFHSHPASPAEPSPMDVREARYDVLQLIAGTASPSEPMQALRAWRLVDDQPTEVRLLIEGRG
jgi:[CysO sulfur-carrier protein]-S-L-cysteine hydrolase